MIINPLTAIDFYKADHRRQYPEGTTLVYSNFTPRSDKLFRGKTDGVIFFGLQYFIKEFLIDVWETGFFGKDKDTVVLQYARRMDTSLGKGAIPVEHIVALHDLGYLPIEIRALPEGDMVPIGVPCLTVHNTKPEFFWLTNYIETILSCYLWKPMVNATTAFCYKKLLTEYALKTGADLGFVNFQAHDFSMRGMSGPQDAAFSGAAHLTSFQGTDTVLAIDLLELYYKADATKELIGGSVPATEHSVMCMGGESDEIGTFQRLITELYPKGIVSIVSDTWDFWKVITIYASQLQNIIMKRDGKVVFRPDSGDPVKIICGDPESDSYVIKRGAVENLWNIFGGTVNSKGYKVLDSHVGLIYGDSITLERAEAILKGLEAKGFCSSNIVFGVGSYTYQHVTRDTFGLAVKATYGVVNGKPRNISKNPKTDDGTKKSAKGILTVQWDQHKEPGRYVLKDMQESLDLPSSLEVVYKDGKLLKEHSLGEIRERVKYFLGYSS